MGTGEHGYGAREADMEAERAHAEDMANGLVPSDKVSAPAVRLYVWHYATHTMIIRLDNFTGESGAVVRKGDASCDMIRTPHAHYADDECFLRYTDLYLTRESAIACIEDTRKSYADMPWGAREVTVTVMLDHDAPSSDQHASVAAIEAALTAGEAEHDARRVRGAVGDVMYHVDSARRQMAEDTDAGNYCVVRNSTVSALIQTVERLVTVAGLPRDAE